MPDGPQQLTFYPSRRRLIGTASAFGLALAIVMVVIVLALIDLDMTTLTFICAALLLGFSVPLLAQFLGLLIRTLHNAPTLRLTEAGISDADHPLLRRIDLLRWEEISGIFSYSPAFTPSPSPRSYAYLVIVAAPTVDLTMRRSRVAHALDILTPTRWPRRHMLRIPEILFEDSAGEVVRQIHLAFAQQIRAHKIALAIEGAQIAPPIRGFPASRSPAPDRAHRLRGGWGRPPGQRPTPLQADDTRSS